MKHLLLVALLIGCSLAHCPWYSKYAVDPYCCRQSSKLSASGQCFCGVGGCYWVYPIGIQDHALCCGELKRHDVKLCFFATYCHYLRSVYQYQPTYYEKNGWCRRIPSMPWDKGGVPTLPNPLPGPCSCKETIWPCFTSVPTMKPATARPTRPVIPATARPTTSKPATARPTTSKPATARPTTSKPVTPRPTTPIPGTARPITFKPATARPTTAKPVTARPTTPKPVTARPTTAKPTTARPITPKPVTARPTTPIPGLACPAPLARFSGRMVGSSKVRDPCALNGIVNFRTGHIQACNGVLGFDPGTESNRVLLTEFCLFYMKAVSNAQDLLIVGLFDSTVFKITSDSPFTYVANHIGSMSAPEPDLLYPRSSCELVPACLFDPDTMSSAIDFSSCYIASYGYDSLIGRVTFNSGNLNRVDVAKQSTCETSPVTPGGECFAAVDHNVQACWGDNGAPVYCPLSTGETVLYGLVDAVGEPPIEITHEAQDNMCETAEFHVLPVSKRATGRRAIHHGAT